MKKKILSLILAVAMLGVYIALPTASSAAASGYGTDLSYEVAALSGQNGTFNAAEIRRVFNGVKDGTNGTLANKNASTTSTVTATTGETVTWSLDKSFNRTDDGTHGLKFDFSKSGEVDGLGINMATQYKATEVKSILPENNRDIYVSYWMKADNYWTNSDNITDLNLLRGNAPLCVSIYNGNAVVACMTEEDYVETDANGWRKVECIIKAANTGNLRFILSAKNKTSGVYKVDRDYVLVDDFYITEIPTSMAWADTTEVNVGENVSEVDLSDYAVTAIDAANEETDVTSSEYLKYEVVSGDAEIVDGKLVRKAFTDGTVSVKAKMLNRETSVKNFVFTKKLVDAGNFGKNLSYDVAALSGQNGTFNAAEIRRVFNGAREGTKGTLANKNASTTSTVTASTGETVTWSLDKSFNRTDDGTHGLKFDFSKSGEVDGLGIYMATKYKATEVGSILPENNRDIYVSYWMKADNYWTNSDNVTDLNSLRGNAPLCVAIYNGNDVIACMTEEDYVETDANGWRKVECIIKAADTRNLRFILSAKNKTSDAYKVDRDYVLVDDFYITEVPSAMVFENAAVESNSSEAILGNNKVYGANAAGVYSDITEQVKYSVKSGEAQIVDNKLCYTGEKPGKVVVEATMPNIGNNVKATAEYSFPMADITEKIDAEFTKNDDGTYSVKLNNYMNKACRPIVLVTVYNAADNVKSVKVTKLSSDISAYGEVTVTTEAVDTTGITAPKIRGFVWNSMDDLVPLCVSRDLN